MAKEAMEAAYAPYSGFRVGAALVTRAGKVYTGANVENASYGLTLCAERVAVARAVTAGERKIRAIAVAASSGRAVFPCGACRQTLNEFADDTAVIVITGRAGRIEKHRLEDLLPHSFGPGALED